MADKRFSAELYTIPLAAVHVWNGMETHIVAHSYANSDSTHQSKSVVNLKMLYFT